MPLFYRAHNLPTSPACPHHRQGHGVRLVLVSCFLLPGLGCTSTKFSSTNWLARKKTPTENPAQTLADQPTVGLGPLDLADAESNLKRRLLQDSQNAKLYTQLGQIQLRLEYRSAAKQSFERALALDSKDHDARLGLAQTLFELGETHQAKELADRVARKQPGRAEALALVGACWKQQARNDLALDWYRKAWQARPPSLPAGLALAQWEADHQQQESARSKLRQILVYDPQNLDARRLYAQLLEDNQQINEAIVQWEFLRDAGDADPSAYDHLAQLYLRRGDERLAYESYDRARQLQPADANARVLEKELVKSSTGPGDVRTVSVDYPSLQAGWRLVKLPATSDRSNQPR